MDKEPKVDYELCYFEMKQDPAAEVTSGHIEAGASSWSDPSFRGWAGAGEEDLPTRGWLVKLIAAGLSAPCKLPTKWIWWLSASRDTTLYPVWSQVCS